MRNLFQHLVIICFLLFWLMVGAGTYGYTKGKRKVDIWSGVDDFTIHLQIDNKDKYYDFKDGLITIYHDGSLIYKEG